MRASFPRIEHRWVNINNFELNLHTTKPIFLPILKAYNYYMRSYWDCEILSNKWTQLVLVRNAIEFYIPIDPHEDMMLKILTKNRAFRPPKLELGN